ncbi:MAG: GNAT family N-acetyltransferase [Rhodospirillaceae bacterium]
MPRIAAPGPEVFTEDPLGDAHVRCLEAIATAAWPPAERRSVDGWVMRRSPAKTRRVNSTLVIRVDGGLTLAERIAAVEDYYTRHDQPPRFQISRAALPDGLDAELAVRGYQVEAPVDIQIAAPAGITRAGQVAPAGDIDIAARADDAWMAVYAEGFGRDVTTVTERIAAPTAFLSFRDGGAVVGVGLGVLEQGWLGLFGMLTRAERRGQGIGAAMAGRLAAWALEQGAVGVYLQVEKDNPGARRLYERLGFRTVYDYHYRTLFR